MPAGHRPRPNRLSHDEALNDHRTMWGQESSTPTTNSREAEVRHRILQALAKKADIFIWDH